MKKLIALILALVMILALCACGAKAGSKGQKTIGILMPTKEQTIWSIQGERLVAGYEAAGYKTEIEYAEDDASKQAMQIENMITKGADALIIGSHGSVAINGDAVKTSAGALYHLPVCKVDNLQHTLQYLRDSGFHVVAATEHATENYTEVDMTAPAAIVMGSEEKGIYEANLRICSHQVRIPMSGVIESLNVSVAAGVMLYEAVRQRG